ncbi:hypothetical protein BBH56_03495 [Spiribacter roseus]|nr:hypothetical protein BBH56_03495 [Spiribacter roseus]
MLKQVSSEGIRYVSGGEFCIERFPEIMLYLIGDRLRGLIVLDNWEVALPNAGFQRLLFRLVLCRYG